MDKTVSRSRIKKALSVLIGIMIIFIAVARPSVYAASKSIQIKVEQIFNTNSAHAEDASTYVMRPLDSSSQALQGGSTGAYTFTIKGSGTYTIGPLAFNKAGMHRYELYQNAAAGAGSGAGQPGYSYDSRRYTIEVQVDSALNATVIVYNSDNKKTDNVIFENSFKLLPTDPKLMADPPIKKTVSGDPARNGEFTFTLKPSGAHYPMPAGSMNGVKTVRISGPGEAEFGTWSYSQAGTYFYTVNEVNAGERGYTYDKAVYTITDKVTEEGGRLVLSRIVTNEMNKPVVSLDFHNSYSPIGGVLGGLKIERDDPVADRPEEDKPWGFVDVEDNPFAYLWDDENPFGNAPGGVNDAGTGTHNATPAAARPGIFGPKTGDDTNATLYIALFAAGGLLVAGALVFIVINKKNKKRKTIA